MSKGSDGSNNDLSHFHACVHCGSLYRREEFDSTTITTGIYPCSKCGLDGPLNIVIRNVDDAETDVGHSSPHRSAG